MIIGEDKVINWEDKRAAVDRGDGQIDLYEISQLGEKDWFGKIVARIQGPMVRGEAYVKTGVIPHESVRI